MNFYDKIHELVRCFKETEEYKKYIELKTKIKQDNEKYERLKEFKTKQRDHQVLYINGKEISEGMQNDIKNLYSLIIQDEDSRSLLETEMRIDVLLADMQKIMGESIKEIIEF